MSEYRCMECDSADSYVQNNRVICHNCLHFEPISDEFIIESKEIFTQEFYYDPHDIEEYDYAINHCSSDN